MPGAASAHRLSPRFQAVALSQALEQTGSHPRVGGAVPNPGVRSQIPGPRLNLRPGKAESLGRGRGDPGINIFKVSQVILGLGATCPVLCRSSSNYQTSEPPEGC